jgi:hypothetical protein
LLYTNRAEDDSDGPEGAAGTVIEVWECVRPLARG